MHTEGHPVQTDPLSRGLFHEVRSWARDLILAVVIAVIFVVFLYQPVKVEGISMQPELVDQERIFVNKFIYHFRPIQRGEVVVFWYPLDPKRSYIKRVIGLPGETIELVHGRVHINGRELTEHYVPRIFSTHENFPKLKIEEGHYFVMGDHRNFSYDSRAWGLVPQENIFGKAVLRYWPLEKFGVIR